jgi:ankyrin repeat protein
MTALYIELLPSELNVEMLEYLDIGTLIELVELLDVQPELYSKLYARNKLKTLYKQYVSTKIPDSYKSQTLLWNYLYYRGLSVPFLGKVVRPITPKSREERKKKLVQIRDTTYKLIDEDWDVAIITYLGEVKAKLTPQDFRINLLEAYVRAIDNDNLNIFRIIFEKFDEYLENTLEYSIEKGRPDVTLYILDTPDFSHLSDGAVMTIIARNVKRLLNSGNIELLNYFHSRIPKHLESLYYVTLLEAMISERKPLEEIHSILDKLVPAIESQEVSLTQSLNLALESRNLSVAELLLEYGADINDDEDSPLGSALASRDKDVIRFAIEHGADTTHDMRENLSVLREMELEVNDEVYAELFNALTEGIDIHRNDDEIYVTLASDRPAILLELLKQEPNYQLSPAVTNRLLAAVDERIEDETFSKKEGGPDFRQDRLDKFTALKRYIIGNIRKNKPLKTTKTGKTAPKKALKTTKTTLKTTKTTKTTPVKRIVRYRDTE